MIEITKSIIDAVLPAIVAVLLPLLTKKLIDFINSKQKLAEIKISAEQEKLIQDKIIEAVKYAEEKAFQAWKDSEKKELSSKEKLNLATEQVLNSNLPLESKEIEKKIESKLPDIREELDKKYTELKNLFKAKESDTGITIKGQIGQ